MASTSASDEYFQRTGIIWPVKIVDPPHRTYEQYAVQFPPSKQEHGNIDMVARTVGAAAVIFPAFTWALKYPAFSIQRMFGTFGGMYAAVSLSNAASAAVAPTQHRKTWERSGLVTSWYDKESGKRCRALVRGDGKIVSSIDYMQPGGTPTELPDGVGLRIVKKPNGELFVRGIDLDGYDYHD